MNEIEAKDTVDLTFHRVISFEPAESAEEDGRIVMRFKRGFTWHGPGAAGGRSRREALSINLPHSAARFRHKNAIREWARKLHPDRARPPFYASAHEQRKAVGIDLGTTFCAIAHIDAYGKPQIIPNAESERITPSVILFDGSNAIVGTLAKHNAVAEPEKIVDFVKREMGKTKAQFHREFNGKIYSAEELVRAHPARSSRTTPKNI